ncbi:MAG: DNA mismatch repair endonuclease MutL [Mesotoga sp.]|nr:DNA mismatch repair endonuclease MutL [Mesotoga sp.]
MIRIHELPGEVVRKIAAGEVVTGCYSVLKELVENSIDAGASLVEVEIRSGGKEYIRVRDNGTGMTAEEARLSLKPHTTSKIAAIEDLDSLSTFGFRGEALSTIASVSRMLLSTVGGEDTLGVTLEVTAGEVSGEKFFKGARGTTVEVFDLLFNTPARRKFLKSVSIEGRMVTEMMQRFILSFHNVDFLYIRDNQTIYDTRGLTGIEDRVLMIYPELSRRDLLPFREETREMRVEGLVTLPVRTRRNRMGENIFVNGRYVRQFELNYALERGYGEALEKGNFPFAVVFIQVDPVEVDVNIHPQKLEVKFASPATVLEGLKRAVRSAIRNAGSFTIDIQPPSTGGEESTVEERDEPQIRYRDRAFPTDRTDRKSDEVKEPSWRNYDRNESMPLSVERRLFRPYTESRKDEALQKRVQDRTGFLGVLGERYILVESGEGLLIVDQHAAHERILYERLKEKMVIDSQNLLVPVELSFEAGREELLTLKRERIEQLGFNFRFENDKILLVAIPQLLPVESAVETLGEVIDELRLEGLEEPERVFDNLLATIACRSAIRTGDKLDIGQARELFEELRKRQLLVCPHGRPISMVIRQEDLDRYFSR